LKEGGKETEDEKEVFICVKLWKRCEMEEIGRDDQEDDRTLRN
jgi:hypothetical protein